MVYHTHTSLALVNVCASAGLCSVHLLILCPEDHVRFCGRWAVQERRRKLWQYPLKLSLGCDMHRSPSNLIDQSMSYGQVGGGDMQSFYRERRRE